MSGKSPKAAPQADRSAERLITAIMGVFFLVMAWLTLLENGIALKGKSGAVSWVTGSPSTWIALASLGFAALSFALLLRSLNARKSAYLAMLVLVFLPALIFIIVTLP
ncbi:hypothetical protein HQ393_00480 [Chitinibacter bivalviorum]|uniref:Uncharacterized protein n=1 Tax=Chitinibacter bivalviorum TaxID=2739434 RepID=A0A7H9BF71_9NEIS|nr:hypothetical protein [Chitinibacter bivalviorum]QLG86838.1 hypothetical protein HQ393_00480 [Chitinibacter bivalviorum]